MSAKLCAKLESNISLASLLERQGNSREEERDGGERESTHAATMSSNAIASAHLYKQAILSVIASKISSSTPSLLRGQFKTPSSVRKRAREGERSDPRNERKGTATQRHDEDLFLGCGKPRVHLHQVERLELDLVLLDLAVANKPKPSLGSVRHTLRGVKRRGAAKRAPPPRKTRKKANAPKR